MEKSIKITSKQSIKLNNNVGWMYNYRDQFGRDIVPFLIPIVNAGIGVAYDIVQQMGGAKISIENIKKVDRETFEDAVIQLAALELTDVINITWAMAKAADEDISEPREWVKQFDKFPLDTIVPEIVNLTIEGLASEKNSKRLQSLLKELKETEEQTEQPA